MLKTRAYLCQAVTADTSPMFQLASHAYSQARRAIGKVFQIPAKVELAVPCKPQTVSPVSRGIISTLHRRSRGFVTNFAAKSYRSQLIDAAKRRYPIGARVGLFGRVSGFAFVGVGLSTGTQWSQYETDGDFADHFGQHLLFKDIHDMFGIYQKGNDKSEHHFDSMSTLYLDERDGLISQDFQSYEEERLEFDISYQDFHPEGASTGSVTEEIESFELLNADSTEYNNDQSLEVLSGVDVMNVTEGSPVDGTDPLQIYEFSLEECRELEASCSDLLTRIDSESDDIASVYESLLEMNTLLRDWFTTSQVPMVTTETFTCEQDLAIEQLDIDSVMESMDESDGGNELFRSLSSISNQIKQLRSSVYQQNKLLQQAATDITAPEYDRALHVMQSNMSRKESCCGPGPADE